MDKEVRVNVPLQTTDNGMLDRVCPNCEREFRIHKETFQSEHYLNLRCPYCNWISEFDEFTTERQWEYARATAMNEQGRQMIEDTLDEAFGDLADIDGLNSMNQPIPSPCLDLNTDKHRCSDCHFEFETLSAETGSDCPVCRS